MSASVDAQTAKQKTSQKTRDSVDHPSFAPFAVASRFASSNDHDVALLAFQSISRGDVYKDQVKTGAMGGV